MGQEDPDTRDYLNDALNQEARQEHNETGFQIVFWTVVAKNQALWGDPDCPFRAQSLRHRLFPGLAPWVVLLDPFRIHQLDP
jgi:hypothetical protein